MTSRAPAVRDVTSDGWQWDQAEYCKFRPGSSSSSPKLALIITTLRLFLQWSKRVHLLLYTAVSNSKKFVLSTGSRYWSFFTPLWLTEYKEKKERSVCEGPWFFYNTVESVEYYCKSRGVTDAHFESHSRYNKELLSRRLSNFNTDTNQWQNLINAHVWCPIHVQGTSYA